MKIHVNQPPQPNNLIFFIRVKSSAKQQSATVADIHNNRIDALPISADNSWKRQLRLFTSQRRRRKTLSAPKRH